MDVYYLPTSNLSLFVAPVVFFLITANMHVKYLRQ